MCVCVTMSSGFCIQVIDFQSSMIIVIIINGHLTMGRMKIRHHIPIQQWVDFEESIDNLP